MHYKEEKYRKFIDLYMKNEVLESREDRVEFLVQNCINEEEEELIFFLLEKLVFIDSIKYNRLLNTMVDYILDLELDLSITQIAACTMDDQADSSQLVLQSIKHKLDERGAEDFITVNNFNKVVRHYHKGKTNIVVVDELLGSGKTVINREKTFRERKNSTVPYNLYFVFAAGIQNTVEKLEPLDYNIFCSYPLPRGIADNFYGEELERKYSTMLSLELRLAQKIKDKELYDYSLGYGGAEALFTAEDCLSNTPNSVFPIFWWKKDINEKNRKTFLSRYEQEF